MKNRDDTEEDLYKSLIFDRLGINQGMIMENLVAQMLRSRGYELYFHEFEISGGEGRKPNKYEIDLSNLKVLNLSSDEYTILHWLAILMKNRKVRLSTPVMKRGREWLIEHFLPDTKDYDAIIGYRADDSYFSFARAFVNNEISLNQLSYAMRLGKLGEQVVLKSKKAFDEIMFVSYEVCDNTIYYAKRKARDDEAREAFNAELEKEDLNGLFMRDIIREEVKTDDARLR